MLNFFANHSLNFGRQGERYRKAQVSGEAQMTTPRLMLTTFDPCDRLMVTKRYVDIIDLSCLSDLLTSLYNQFVSDSVSAGKERKKNLLEADAEWDLHRREIKDHLQKQKVSSDHFESPWRWAVEGEEPPPSAIVGRRDTVS